MMNYPYFNINGMMNSYSFFPFLFPFVLLDLVLKAFALWKAARNNHLYWFVALMIINSAGILPAIYLIWDSQRKR